jgi:prepilin signal peptidase PulO-like enzyme (type II secretory pathway)
VPFAPFMVAGLLLSLTLGPLIASIYIWICPLLKDLP